MGEEKAPPLVSNVFLTGVLQPDGISPRNEYMVDHVMTKHHSQASMVSARDLKMNSVYEDKEEQK